MKKIYVLILFAFVMLGTNAFSQCTPQAVYPSSAWQEASAPGVPYIGYMCAGHDSLHTRSGWQYFDGDGYFIRLIAGSHVKIYVDSCTGNNTSITVVDSTAGVGAGVPIPGAYIGAACPNTLTFTAPYTGLYTIVFDTDGNCANAGTTVAGVAAVKLLNASSISCPVAGSNDTICGATHLTYNVLVHGNSLLAAVTDPLDAGIVTLGYACFTPNNTLWYSYTPSVTDSVGVYFAADATSGLAGWFGVFSSTAAVNPCALANLTYYGCYYGPLNATPLTTAGPTAPPFDGVVPTGQLVINHLYLQAGTHYFFMIDGVAGSAGGFTFGVGSFTIGVNEVLNNSSVISIYPNPSTGMLNISSNSKAKHVNVSVLNAMGQEVYSSNFEDIFSNRQVDISGMADGIYIVQIKSASGIVSKKIILQNSK
jgi:hypothetical protein